MEPALTLEEVWTVFQESERRHAEAEDRLAAVTRKQAETDRLMKTAREVMRELWWNIEELHHSLDKLVEEVFYSDVWEAFKAFGYRFTQGGRSMGFVEDCRIVAESGVYFKDENALMLVEVKTRVTERDVDEHLKRMETIRRYMDERNDTWNLIGAVAGAVLPGAVLQYAHERGLYALSRKDGAFTVVDPPREFAAMSLPFTDAT
ncbi:MAG: hypothetical protein LBD24_05860 [Spirochaetaceae bacterium]|jgi:hypothetical protein|nr:hypothetical protein [Spirochaetaceae bacterium]